MEAASEEIINFLNSDDVTDAEKRAADLNSSSLLSVFERNSVDVTLEGSSISREHVSLALFLHNLQVAGMLPTLQYT